MYLCLCCMYSEYAYRWKCVSPVYVYVEGMCECTVSVHGCVCSVCTHVGVCCASREQTLSPGWLLSIGLQQWVCSLAPVACVSAALPLVSC